jgi:ferredoxin
MAYVVTENCIKCKYTDCVDVCPVDCFHEGPNFLVIDPEVHRLHAVRGRVSGRGDLCGPMRSSSSLRTPKVWPVITERREPLAMNGTASRTSLASSNAERSFRERMQDSADDGLICTPVPPGATFFDELADFCCSGIPTCSKAATCRRCAYWCRRCRWPWNCGRRCNARHSDWPDRC